MSKTRSRRMRKKLFVGEFKELGFEVDLSFAADADPVQKDAFFMRFFDEAVMPEGLVFAGMDDAGFVCSSRRGSVSEAQRQSVESWLGGQSGLSGFRVGPLMDVWHG